MDINLILDIKPFSWGSILIALFCGGLIGLERQLKGKPTGIRTCSLIILGTYIFMACSIFVTKDSDMTDPSRIIGQIITGIGFLGAGVMLSKGRSVYGVTSAATIWALAAIGICIGIGQLSSAVKLSIVVVLVLFVVDQFEEHTQKMSKRMHNRYTNWRERDND
ncbi:MAG: putative Mg2+ transporter-C (MgtC) family protein [Bermanella sp.]|jgi:putative Mg2+ transporter-C (MgtC) family protein